MSATQEFLKIQHHELELELEKARTALEQARRDVERLEDRVIFTEELLKKTDTAMTTRSTEGITDIGQKETAWSLIRRMLREHGPATTRDLHELIQKQGSTMSKASLATILSRQKGKKQLVKVQRDKWDLALQ